VYGENRFVFLLRQIAEHTSHATGAISPKASPANAKPRQHRFVFRKDLFRHQPGEAGMVKPLSEELGARRERRPFLERSDSYNDDRSVYDPSTPGALRRQR
jgi:hypothetical protein